MFELLNKKFSNNEYDDCNSLEKSDVKFSLNKKLFNVLLFKNLLYGYNKTASTEIMPSTIEELVIFKPFRYEFNKLDYF